MINYRIPWWLRDALRRVENALVRKVLGQSAMPGGLDWFRRQFVDWKHGRIDDYDFALIVEDYVNQLQEAGEVLLHDGRLYELVLDSTWLENGDLEWEADYPAHLERTSRPEDEAESFTRHA